MYSLSAVHQRVRCSSMQRKVTIYIYALSRLQQMCSTLDPRAHVQQTSQDSLTILQHTATHCNTLQHTAAHCSTLQHTATHCNTLQHTATHCNTLQHTATHSRLFDSQRGLHICCKCAALSTPAHMCCKRRLSSRELFAANVQHCNTLQHTATHSRL